MGARACSLLPPLAPALALPLAQYVRGRALVLALAFTLALFALPLLPACGKLQSFGGGEPPLVTFNVMFSGELAPLRPPGVTTEPSLRVALVWGQQWLQEPFCILPPESEAAAALIAAGCRDPFGFVPASVDVSVPIAIGENTSLPLLYLPTPDLLVGDITGRVGYASLVVYDERGGSPTLDLSQPHQAPLGSDGRRGGNNAPVDQTADSADIIYGASFVTMTAPDQRVAYLEGKFVASAFYPRSGCAPPHDGFSVLGAGGFDAATALVISAAGEQPPEDPASCTSANANPKADPEADPTANPTGPVVSIVARAPEDLAELDCDERRADSSIRYHEPPATSPDLVHRQSACVHLPSFDTAGTGGTPSTVIQLVVSGLPGDRCKGLTHYTLRGCRQDPVCTVPDWDITATPPAWWPCPI